MMSTLNLPTLVNWKGWRETCSRRGCRTGWLRHSWLPRIPGMRIGEDWYCCPECFRCGATERIRKLQDLALRRSAPHRSRIPLGLLLVTRGSITKEQWRQAEERQKQTGGTLGKAVCDLRFTGEREVAAAAAAQWGCLVYSSPALQPEIRAHIPTPLMRAAMMAPVFQAPANRRLLVGFAHAVDHALLGTLEEMTSCASEPCFITASECERCIQALAGRHSEVVFERALPLLEIANIVVSYAQETSADEARFGFCQDFLWTRLNRNNQPTDQLFALRDEPSNSARTDWLGGMS